MTKNKRPPLTDGQRWVMGIRHDPGVYDFDCPRCGSKQDLDCRNLVAGTPTVNPHNERVAAYVDSLKAQRSADNQMMQAAYAEQQAEEKALAEQVACPSCRRPAGDHCVNLEQWRMGNNGVPTVYPHASRLQLAIRERDHA